jgi:hypothetical protein
MSPQLATNGPRKPGRLRFAGISRKAVDGARSRPDPLHQRKTVYSFVSRYLIPHYKIKAKVRFRARDLATWLRHHAVPVRIRPAVASKRAMLHT